MKQIWTAEQAALILNNADLLKNAQIVEGQTQVPRDIIVANVTLTANTALNRANAMPFDFPFRSLYVAKTSHPDIELRFVPNTLDSFQGDIPIHVESSIDFGMSLTKGFIFWDSQNPGPATLTATIVFSVSSVIKSASIRAIKGGVKTDMYSNAGYTIYTLIAAGPATSMESAFLAALAQVPGSFVLKGSDRSLFVQNQSGANVFVGPFPGVDDGTSAGGLNQGQIIGDGEFYKWNNKQDLWAFSTGGGNVSCLLEF